MSIFRGSGVAIVTPMKENGEVNYDAYEALLEDQIKNHTDAVITVGTSGEAPTLDDDEQTEPKVLVQGDYVENKGVENKYNAPVGQVIEHVDKLEAKVS